MKKSIWLITLLFISVAVMAQDNHRVKFYNGKVEYKKPSTLNVISGLLDATNKDPQLGLEDKSIVPELISSIKAAPSTVYRLMVQEGDAPERTSEEAYTLNVTLSNVMTYTGKNQGAQANMLLSLVDLRTGKEIAKKKTGGYDVYAYTTKAEGVTYLATSLNKLVRQFLWSYFPISGTIVQKGVEQNNGKVKDNQCYIDLANNYGAFEGMRLIVYTEDNGKLKEIGALKVKEVEGDELSSCSITSGNSKIEKAIANGQKIVVMTKTPKK